ncbi:MAG: LPS export ABC transporter periplasmic protein LptC, partial [Planctomycetota bacterium]
MLLFFALFTPLAYILWLLAGDAPPPVSLTAPAREVESEPVLDTKDIPQLPIRGEVLEFRRGRIQRFHPTDHHIEYWVRIEGIEKFEGRPRLKGIRCAIFGEPKGGEAQLKLTIDAPYLDGNPLALLSTRKGVTREITLGGGVVVRDERGRTLAELESLKVDLDKGEVHATVPVLFRSPQKNAQLRGKGLRADLQFGTATLYSDVRARLPLGDRGKGVATLSCLGPATLVRVPDS